MVKIAPEFIPYPHTIPTWRAMFERDIKRFFLVMHRRGAKDRTSFEIMWRKAIRRTGNYVHAFPTLAQGKKALWDSLDANGQRIFDYIPKELQFKKHNASDYKIYLRSKDNFRKEGSTIQLASAIDGADSLRGTNLCGAILSEFPLMDPDVYQSVEPALRKTKGWMILNGTPMGHNHAYDFYNNVSTHPAWHTEYLPVQCTQDHFGNPLIDAADLRIELDSGAFSEAKFRQEYLCDWDAAIEGCKFTRELEHAMIQGRIGDVTIAPGVPVSAFLDIGVNAKTGVTAVWFVQFLDNGNVRFVDYFEASDQPAEFYVNKIFDWRDTNHVTLNKCYLPHDARSREKISCSSYADRYCELGMPTEIIPRIARKDLAIEASRKFFRTYYIDSKKCSRGIQALREYRSEIIHKVHWANHSVDAFLAVGQWLELQSDKRPLQQQHSGSRIVVAGSAW